MTEHTTMPFPGTCVVEGMSANLYHQIDALSASALKLLSKSPRHLWLSRQQPVEPTPAMILGTATHTLVFEPEKVDTILVAEQCVGTTKSGPNAGASCKNSGIKLVGGRWYCGVHGRGMTTDDGMGAVLSQDDFNSAKAMARAVHAHRVANKIVTSPTAKVEVSFFWTESVTVPFPGGSKTIRWGGRNVEAETLEIPCKLRADHWDGGWITDLKTCQCSQREDFQRDIAERGYHIQAAWYLDGIAKATGGVEQKAFRFIAVESAPENCVCVYRASDSLLTFGRETYADLLMVYADCVLRNEWPGYDDYGQRECDVPQYFIKNQEREMKRV